MMKDRLHVMRVIPLLVIVASSVILSSVLCLMQEVYWDVTICVTFIDILFLFIFIFELEYERKHRMLANNIATTFSRVAFGYVLCCLLGLFFMICPSYYMPVMLFPIIMCAVGNEFLGITVGMYFIILYAIIYESPSNEIICYTLLVVIGAGLTKTLYEKHFRKYISFILFCCCMMIPFIFRYLSFQKFSYWDYMYGVCCGLVTAFAAFFLFYRMRRATDAELDNHLWDIIDENYPEVKKIKTHFPADYHHAKLVSDMAIFIAQKIGLNPALCGAAGFYYRIGKWSGDDYIAAGVEKAQNLNFPMELVRIIYEYNGQVHKPSTPESAIIHMIDSLTIKMDALNQDVAQSVWNHEMIIYQTLNEFSSAGLYDESGLSMNQFLKVREFLVKEISHS